MSPATVNRSRASVGFSASEREISVHARPRPAAALVAGSVRRRSPGGAPGAEPLVVHGHPADRRRHDGLDRHRRHRGGLAGARLLLGVRRLRDGGPDRCHSDHGPASGRPQVPPDQARGAQCRVARASARDPGLRRRLVLQPDSRGTGPVSAGLRRRSGLSALSALGPATVALVRRAYGVPRRPYPTARGARGDACRHRPQCAARLLADVRQLRCAEHGAPGRRRGEPRRELGHVPGASGLRPEGPTVPPLPPSWAACGASSGP